MCEKLCMKKERRNKNKLLLQKQTTENGKHWSSSPSLVKRAQAVSRIYQCVTNSSKKTHRQAHKWRKQNNNAELMGKQKVKKR